MRGKARYEQQAFLDDGRKRFEWPAQGQLRTIVGAKAKPVVSAIHGFRPNELIVWAHELGQRTFVGSSGRGDCHESGEPS